MKMTHLVAARLYRKSFYEHYGPTTIGTSTICSKVHSKAKTNFLILLYNITIILLLHYIVFVIIASY